MHRVLIVPHAVRGREITVTDPDALHHLLDVLRIVVGDRLECFDGQGLSYAGQVIRLGRQALTLAIDTRTQEPRPRLAITLAQALIRPEFFEWVIQKSTELGVVQVIPMLTSRTRVRLPSPRLASAKPGLRSGAAGLRQAGLPRHGGSTRLERWRRIAEAATAQCGRCSLPIITAPQAFEDVLKTVGPRYALLPTLVEGGTPLGDHGGRLQGVREAVLLIGPEGDFSAEEVALAKGQGVHLVTLGRATLRSETAAIAALAIVQHLVGAL